MNELLTNQPIAKVEWVDARNLNANDYNPNVVLNLEMQLLAFSLLKTGWIQPILVTPELVIIDGFHRSYLSTHHPEIIKVYNYQVPVVKLELNEPERMLLTVRINRAKGAHVAVKMHDLVGKLFHEFHYSAEQIAREIGATMPEVELLLKENVFQNLDIPNHRYSKAWIPKK